MDCSSHHHAFGRHSHATKLTIALSTLGHKLESILRLLKGLSVQSKNDFELLVVAQTTDPELQERLLSLFFEWSHYFPVRILFSSSKGLLTSRNIALAHSNSEWTLLCDDDCRYYPNSVELILEQLKPKPLSQIITFVSSNQTGEPRNSKIVKKGQFKHNLRTIMSVSSIEIMINLSYIRAANGRIFDERFGLGTPFNTGGENIMLSDAIKRGICVEFLPIDIVSHPEISSGHDEKNIKQMAFAKGAMFKRLFGKVGLPVLLLFILKKACLREAPRFSLKHLSDAILGFLQGPSGNEN